MAARRSLGGGRVLGSGRSLAPPAPTKPTHQRTTSLLSPSESSVSLSSQTSSTPVSTQDEDIMSKVATGDQGPSVLASVSSKLMCPICSEEMVTLLQLNRHLDDNHQNLEEVQQDEVKNWFDQQVEKARKFQPIAVLNQRLRGLDVFEPNGVASPPRPASAQSPNRQSSPARASAGPPPPEPRVIDPDEVVSRTHWQRATGMDACTDPKCGKRLGTTNGSINCRHCGKLFCEEHTMYQMKLSRSAKHEPVRGYWCRVCETCYKSRDGYNDHNGLERNYMKDFMDVRRRTVDKQYLEISRLEKRLTRLTQLLANPPPPESEPGATGFLRSFAGNRNHLRSLEQSVVTWEDDAKVAQCPFCQQPFSQYSFRRHHCRICGRVVCGDPDTGCSTEIALNVAKDSDQSEKNGNQVPVDVRMCKDCQHTIFSKADFAREVSQQPPDQRAYQNLVQFQRGIQLLLPKFQRLLQTLQDPENPPSPAQIAEAGKVRKRLMDAFTQYDVAARRIRDMPTTLPTQEKLQKAVYLQASTFLHLHMLPLKSLPKIIRHAVPNGARTSGSPLAVIRKEHTNGLARRDSSASTSTTSTANAATISALEAEEKELRERLIVLEEQKFMVQEILNDAKKKRRFDEVNALSGNVDDLSREIDTIQARLRGMDFEGAYLGDIGG
ncbi:Vacuolar segregation protein pep7 [Sphaceloma murrayae]|uniref:Vacuolar segregation protein pep7 n=1 Tax=Sphaceloma murrayae TaxID=2082308 RepID=A0A2K1R1F6_9PEZI|nr:Vacuolar segregation protein pep7 [Sphaceloma murrayae]